jgi:hypothetical protein
MPSLIDHLSAQFASITKRLPNDIYEASTGKNGAPAWFILYSLTDLSGEALTEKHLTAAGLTAVGVQSSKSFREMKIFVDKLYFRCELALQIDPPGQQAVFRIVLSGWV